MTALTDLSEALAAAAARAATGTVLVDARRRFPASGIAWAPDVVVTASHVVERDEDISVGLPDGRKVAATLVGRDVGSDIAVLRLAESALEPAPRSTSAAQPGHLVLAIGRPSSGGHMASFGAVAGVGGPWRTFRGSTVGGYIRAGITMFPGFSGGPLVDSEGAVLGMNSSLPGPGGGIAIPVAALDGIVNDILSSGHVRRGYLGISTQPVRLPQSFASVVAEGQATALLLSAVEPGSPAERGGLLVGDILIKLADEVIASTDDLQAQLGAGHVGVAVEAVVVRGGNATSLTITIGERD